MMDEFIERLHSRWNAGLHRILLIVVSVFLIRTAVECSNQILNIHTWYQTDFARHDTAGWIAKKWGSAHPLASPKYTHHRDGPVPHSSVAMLRGCAPRNQRGRIPDEIRDTHTSYRHKAIAIIDWPGSIFWLRSLQPRMGGLAGEIALGLNDKRVFFCYFADKIT